MSDFRMVRGFEDVWRPPVRTRVCRPEAVLSSSRGGDGQTARARLARIVRRAPEVMVKVTGRVRDARHLRAHLDYISRNGAVELEVSDGASIAGARDVREAADDWSGLALADPRRRATTPITVSLILSMPAGSDPIIVRDAARAFAHEALSPTFDWVLALHTDADHPHVHFAVRALGSAGERLNPKKGDLEAWRQIFARALRDRGLDAEATPRRARGVTLKAERHSLRKMRERSEEHGGAAARVARIAYIEAAKTAVAAQVAPAPWETQLTKRQRLIRSHYLAQAKLLATSPARADRALAEALTAFVEAMPVPDSRRLALARELRASVQIEAAPTIIRAGETRARK